MTAWLDLIALAVVIAASVFLLWPRRNSRRATCAPASKSAATRIPLERLRASAREVSGRR